MIFAQQNLFTLSSDICSNKVRLVPEFVTRRQSEAASKNDYDIVHKVKNCFHYGLTELNKYR